MLGEAPPFAHTPQGRHVNSETPGGLPKRGRFCDHPLHVRSLDLPQGTFVTPDERLAGGRTIRMLVHRHRVLDELSTPRRGAWTFSSHCANSTSSRTRSDRPAWECSV